MGQGQSCRMSFASRSNGTERDPHCILKSGGDIAAFSCNHSRLYVQRMAQDWRDEGHERGPPAVHMYPQVQGIRVHAVRVKIISPVIVVHERPSHAPRLCCCSHAGKSATSSPLCLAQSADVRSGGNYGVQNAGTATTPQPNALTSRWACHRCGVIRIRPHCAASDWPPPQRAGHLRACSHGAVVA